MKVKVKRQNESSFCLLLIKKRITFGIKIVVIACNQFTTKITIPIEIQRRHNHIKRYYF